MNKRDDVWRKKNFRGARINSRWEVENAFILIILSRT